jgi:thiol:disulfide interchange protein DsbG
LKLSTLTLSISLPIAAALVLNLAACSKTETPTTPAPGAPAATAAPVVSGTSYDKVAATGKGFTVGSLMSAQAVYVLFDPQCPHCGHLWQASIPLHSKVKFVWIPVGFSDKSRPQAVALLSATNPTEAMTAHEASLLAGQGGIAASSNMTDELERAVKGNTQLLTALGADSVPFIVAKNRRTGEVISFNGAMETDKLAQFLGVD